MSPNLLRIFFLIKHCNSPSVSPAASCFLVGCYVNKKVNGMAPKSLSAFLCKREVKINFPPLTESGLPGLISATGGLRMVCPYYSCAGYAPCHPYRSGRMMSGFSRGRWRYKYYRIYIRVRTNPRLIAKWRTRSHSQRADTRPSLFFLYGRKSRIAAVQQAQPQNPLPKMTGPKIFATR